MLASLTQDNWIALDETLALGLPEGRYFDVSIQDGRVVLTPVRLSDREVAREWAPELVQTGRSWLAAAEREFEAERDLAGSRCLWEAVRAAIAAVGIERGLPDETDSDMLSLVKALDEEAGDRYLQSGRFSVAQSFRLAAAGELHWEDYEFDAGRRIVKRLFDTLTALATDRNNL